MPELKYFLFILQQYEQFWFIKNIIFVTQIHSNLTMLYHKWNHLLCAVCPSSRARNKAIGMHEQLGTVLRSRYLSIFCSDTRHGLDCQMRCCTHAATRALCVTTLHVPVNNTRVVPKVMSNNFF